MAYTAEERAKIRLYLGWPAAFYETSDALEQSMDNISASRPQDEANARDLLGKIAALDTAIETMIEHAIKATKVGAIDQRANYQHHSAQKRGEVLVRRLANIHGVAPQGGFFTDRQAPHIDPRAGNAGSYELVEG